MNAWLIPLLISVGVPAIVAIVLRVFPKVKLINITVPITKKLFKALNVFLLIKLGKKAAESVEEGIVISFLAVLQENIRAAVDTLREDNSK